MNILVSSESFQTTKQSRRKIFYDLVGRLSAEELFPVWSINNNNPVWSVEVIITGDEADDCQPRSSADELCPVRLVKK